MGDFDFLKEYKPEKVANNFAPFKGNYTCIVNHARIEEYEGEKEEFKGHKFFRYELEVAAEQPNAGRRLWKSVNLMDEKEDKKGKTRPQKLADSFFTLGLDITKPGDREKFVEASIKVNCYFFKPQDSDDQIQMHSLKEIVGDAEKAPSSVPF